MKKFILLISFIVWTGCTATMVNRPGSHSQFGPTNEGSRPGTVKYLNQGADSVIESRRKDAYKQMYQACHGKYKILSEGPNAEGGAFIPVGNALMYSQSQYWYINFQCE